MKTYIYTALDYQGRERSGQIEAEDDLAANRKLKDDGLFPTSLSDVAAFKTEKTVLEVKKKTFNFLGYKITIEKSLL